MRRSYLKSVNVTTKAKNSGLNKEGMSRLYDHMKSVEGHRLEIDNGTMTFLDLGKEWRRIISLMETRSRMLVENRHHSRTIKERLLWVVLQESKYFKLVLFWNTGAGRYYFIKVQVDLVSMSKPYVSRDSAMDAHQHRDIFWLDFVRIPTH